MGQGKVLKCEKCGNEWSHYTGVGFKMKPMKSSKKDNITSDDCKEVKCPKCDSKNFNDSPNVTFFWD